MDLTQVLICGTIFLALYKVIELFVRRRERLMLIEKIEKLDSASVDQLRQGLDRPNNSSAYWPLRIGATLVGLGFGIGLSLLAIRFYPMTDVRQWQIFSYLQSFGLLMGAGLGLLTAFIVERKLKQKKESK